MGLHHGVNRQKRVAGVLVRAGGELRSEEL